MQETMRLTGSTEPLSPEIIMGIAGNEHLHQGDFCSCEKARSNLITWGL